mgnify:CR=1 FL=1
MNTLVPPQSGRWRTVRLQSLPGSPDAVGRGLPVRASIRLAEPVDAARWDSFAAACDEGLGWSLAEIVERTSWESGRQPPFVLQCRGEVTIGGVIEVGRLTVGIGGPALAWGGGRLDVPLGRAEAAMVPPDEEDFTSAEPPGGPGLHGAEPGEEFVGDAETPVEAGPGGGDWAEWAAESGAAWGEQFEDSEAAWVEEPEELPPIETPTERALQCLLGPDDRTLPRDNVLREGVNVVDVFLGAPEQGTVGGIAVTDAALGFPATPDQPDREFVVVQVTLTPLAPTIGTPTSAQLLVPRRGRSASVPLSWTVPAGATDARAQLALIRDGLVLAIAELSGRVGERVSFAALLGVGVPDLGKPPASEPPAQAVVIADDGAGRPTLTRPASLEVELLPEYEALADTLNRLLDQALAQRPNTAAGRKAIAGLLVQIARAGSDLYQELRPVLGDLQPGTLQLVTARAPHALPVELLYDRTPPRAGAELCPAWVAGGCADACEASDPASVVCPAGFWGVRGVIERLYNPAEQGEAELSVPAPTAERPELGLDGTAFGASAKVTDAMIKKAKALKGLTRAASWTEWRGQLAGAGCGLLVLLPHTVLSGTADQPGPGTPAMELSRELLHREDVAPDVVTGGRSGRPPAVVLFGCETGGSAADPSGFAMRFLNAGAGVVFSTLAKLGASTASLLADRLIAALRDPARDGQSVAQVLRDVRAEGLREHQVSALALTAYGRTAWEV